MMTRTSVLGVLLYTLLLRVSLGYAFYSNINSLKNSQPHLRLKRRYKGTNQLQFQRGHTTRRYASSFGLPDIPLLPTLVLTTLGIFAIFSIDNKIDITDAGRAESR